MDDPATLGRALMARHFTIWGPDTSEDRRDLATEMLELACSSDDLELAFMAHSVRLTALLELGDIVGVRREIGAVERLYERLQQPIARWALLRWAAMRALMEGRLDDAERLMNEASEAGIDVQDPDAVSQYYGIQLFVLLQERGHLGDIEPAIREEAERSPHLAGYQTALAYLHALAGDVETRASRSRALRCQWARVDHA